MADEYSTGPLLALEVTGQNVVPVLREMAGPRDGEVARRIRPDCLRAKYGTSGAKPGVHVTDLEEDGPLECEYVFSILDKA
jgi:nucleoside-diphosphate kinase